MDEQTDLLRRAAEEWERLRRVAVAEAPHAPVGRPARYIDWAFRSTPWLTPGRVATGSRDTPRYGSAED